MLFRSIGDRLCHIAPADFNLLELFIKTPKHLLTKEDIKNAFWPKDNNPENKKPDALMISSVKVVGNKATVILSGASEGAAGYD